MIEARHDDTIARNSPSIIRYRIRVVYTEEGGKFVLLPVNF
jgi:hypothetical protein